MNLLNHESTHAWQFQHTGPNYIVDSLSHQLADGTDAYKYRSAIAHKPWSELNAEQQAQLIEDAVRDNLIDKSVLAKELALKTTNTKAWSSQELNYLSAALNELRAGRGAVR